MSLSLIVYIAEFEVCNPLGTSRKKHKITAVYWVLANVPSEFCSTLRSIYLAILCKAVDAEKRYEAVLEPLLNDFVELEKEGLFISMLEKTVKGTVVSVVADNLGAHTLAGFLECFNATYFCRFCLATNK